MEDPALGFPREVNLCSWQVLSASWWWVKVWWPQRCISLVQARLQGWEWTRWLSQRRLKFSLNWWVFIWVTVYFRPSTPGSFSLLGSLCISQSALTLTTHNSEGCGFSPWNGLFWEIGFTWSQQSPEAMGWVSQGPRLRFPCCSPVARAEVLRCWWSPWVLLDTNVCLVLAFLGSGHSHPPAQCLSWRCWRAVTLSLLYFIELFIIAWL